MKKTYNLMYKVGSAKYVINYHDGEKKHQDGSPFFDILIFRNKKDFAEAQKTLQAEGYQPA